MLATVDISCSLTNRLVVVDAHNYCFLRMYRSVHDLYRIQYEVLTAILTLAYQNWLQARYVPLSLGILHTDTTSQHDACPRFICLTTYSLLTLTVDTNRSVVRCCCYYPHEPLGRVHVHIYDTGTTYCIDRTIRRRREYPWLRNLVPVTRDLIVFVALASNSSCSNFTDHILCTATCISLYGPYWCAVR